MTEVLDQTQIHERYRSEWVLIGDPQTDETLAVRRGVVLFHSRDREELDRKIIELRPPRFAVIFTGETSGHFAINL
jgi:hypothetical protein